MRVVQPVREVLVQVVELAKECFVRVVKGNSVTLKYPW